LPLLGDRQLKKSAFEIRIKDCSCKTLILHATQANIHNFLGKQGGRNSLLIRCETQIKVSSSATWQETRMKAFQVSGEILNQLGKLGEMKT